LVKRKTKLIFRKKKPIIFFLGGCLGYLITATDWTDSFLSNYMQGQEKLTLFVILLFFAITLCLTLLSANEKIYDAPEEQIPLTDKQNILDSFLPIDFCKFIFNTISNSVRTIITMPFVLRRLTLAECCSWFVNLF
jgi:solute carrier family 45 protein 3